MPSCHTGFSLWALPWVTANAMNAGGYALWLKRRETSNRSECSQSNKTQSKHQKEEVTRPIIYYVKETKCTFSTQSMMGHKCWHTSDQTFSHPPLSPPAALILSASLFHAGELHTFESHLCIIHILFTFVTLRGSFHILRLTSCI